MNTKNNKLAPIVLFVYNRFLHTKKTIEALQNNFLSEESELFIFSDGAHSNDKEKVELIRAYIRKIEGFKKITIIERSQNMGLADNIVDGVSKVINEFEKVIVVEDDIVTSPYFLTFMNSSLNKYENEKKVFHISGWNYPINLQSEFDIFFWPVMNCWGWATWKNRWMFFEKDTSDLLSRFDKNMIKRFDLDDSGVFWKQVLNNQKGKIDTWGIFWYASIFLNEGLCLNPIQSYVRNIGDDGSGINHRGGHKLKKESLNLNSNITFPNEIIESDNAIRKIKNYYKKRRKPFFIRFVNKVRSLQNQLIKRS